MPNMSFYCEQCSMTFQFQEDLLRHYCSDKLRNKRSAAREWKLSNSKSLSKASGKKQRGQSWGSEDHLLSMWSRSGPGPQCVIGGAQTSCNLGRSSQTNLANFDIPQASGLASDGMVQLPSEQSIDIFSNCNLSTSGNELPHGSCVGSVGPEERAEEDFGMVGSMYISGMLSPVGTGSGMTSNAFFGVGTSPTLSTLNQQERMSPPELMSPETLLQQEIIDTFFNCNASGSELPPGSIGFGGPKQPPSKSTQGLLSWLEDQFREECPQQSVKESPEANPWLEDELRWGMEDQEHLDGLCGPGCYSCTLVGDIHCFSPVESGPQLLEDPSAAAKLLAAIPNKPPGDSIAGETVGSKPEDFNRTDSISDETDACEHLLEMYRSLGTPEGWNLDELL